MSRTNKSLKNFITAIIGQSIGLIVSFIARSVFIKFLGMEYLGLNGLFTNILSVLSLAELGIGEAITFSIYKPLANKDQEKCQMLMQLYKKVYTIIGIFILTIGILVTPFLNLFISDMPDIKYINIIYIMFVVNSSVSYFFSYKRNLIIADQNRYIATIYRYGFYFILNVCQIIYLYLTKDYFGFLLIQIVCTLLENIFVSIKANKMYPYLKYKNKIPLDTTSKKEIIKNTKALIMHRIGGIIVSSTDNIILSKFVSLTAVGLYSNYYLITSALNTVFGQVFNSLTASIGNLFATESSEKSYDIFKKVYFLNFCIYSVTCVCLISLFNILISKWIGQQYTLSTDIVLIIVVNFYITGMRKSIITFRDAAGLFYNDRWKSVIEGIINLVFSLIFVKKFGIFGVFLGTFISSISTCVWVEPYVLYKYGFNKKLSSYFKIYFKYLLFTIIIGAVCFIITSKINLGSILINLIVGLIIDLIISISILLLIFHRTEEFKYYYDKLIKIIKNIKMMISKKKNIKIN